MKKTLKILIAFAVLVSGFIITQSTFAEGNACDPSLPAEVLQASGCTSGEQTLDNSLIKYMNAAIAVASIVAVIYVVVGGTKYITSNGDANKLKAAKETILYALIGLAICALAAIIVNFVITNILTGNV